MTSPIRRTLEHAWTLQAMSWRRRGALAAFVKLMWHVVEPRPLEWAPYLDVVCDALHRQMLGEKAYRRLLINIPPGHAKSLLVSVLSPAFEWLFDAGRRKVFFSGDDSLSKRDSRRMRNLLKSDDYQRLLTELCRRERRIPWRFSKDQDEKINFENTQRGFRACLTMRSGVTGKRGDDFVIDDPLDVKAVTLGAPDTIQRRCAETQGIIDQALQTRVNDLRDARQTIIMQRLHPEDPSGHAIREGGWKVICLPLRYDPDHPQACADDPRTELGELLHPARYPSEELERLEKKLGAAQASAQLAQRPMVASGGRIKRSWFSERYRVDPLELAAQAEEVSISSDAAKKGNDANDMHSIQVWARLNGKKYLLERYAQRVNYPEYEKLMDGVIAKWARFVTKAGICLIEDTANGTTYMQVKGSSVFGVSLVDFRPTRDTEGTDKSKGARATFLERAAESRAIMLPDPSVVHWPVEDVITWWCAFPLGKHDDDVDSASQLLMRWSKVESAPVSPWELFGGAP